MPTSASLVRAVTLAFALREYLVSTTPPKVGVVAQHGNGNLRQHEEGDRLEVIEEDVMEEHAVVENDTALVQDSDSTCGTRDEGYASDKECRFGDIQVHRNNMPALQPPQPPVELQGLGSSESKLLDPLRLSRSENSQREEHVDNGAVADEDIRADLDGGDRRSIWHDSHAIVMNIALQAIPFVQTFLIIVTFLEIVTRIASTPTFTEIALQTTLLPILCPSPKQSSQSSKLHPIPNLHKLTTPLTLAQAITTLLVILGSRLRINCFKEMGKQFTFTHTTLSDHRLITSGPYGMVRHPSYTGALIAYLSMVALTIMRGSWVRQCAVISTPIFAAKTPHGWLHLVFVGTVWFACALYAIWGVVVTVGLMLRAPREDETLRARFGSEWENYYERVPARFIPFVF